MSFDHVKRFDRIVAILIQLQSKRIVKAQDLSDRFEVSLRTIYRDIRTLEASGVPIVSEAGVGYSIMEGYRLPPVMFTREEASSFVAAEKLMQKFTDKSLGAYYGSAMYKVKSVLQGADKDFMSALESQVSINPAQDMFNEHIPDALEILFDSIARRKQVSMIYETAHNDSVNERNIEPVGLFHENNYWYVMAYCHLRKDYRQFRTDRILRIKRTDLDFSLFHGTLDQYRNKEQVAEKTRVRILVDREVVRYIKSGRKYHGFVSEKPKGKQVEMTFMTSELEQGFLRWFIMFGDYAKILEPENLKTSFRKLLEESMKRLS